MNSNVVVKHYQYFGDPDTDGTWRMRIDGDGNFEISKRVSGSYVVGQVVTVP